VESVHVDSQDEDERGGEVKIHLILFNCQEVIKISSSEVSSLISKRNTRYLNKT
jgi:hypothetical protein